LETLREIVSLLIKNPEKAGIGKGEMGFLQVFRDTLDSLLQEEEIYPEDRAQLASQVRFLLQQLQR